MELEGQIGYIIRTHDYYTNKVMVKSFVNYEVYIIDLANKHRPVIERELGSFSNNTSLYINGYYG